MNKALTFLFLSQLTNIFAYDLDEEVRVASTTLMAPYHYPKTTSGLETEIIRASFIAKGIKHLELIDSSFKRALNLLVVQKVDALATSMSNTFYNQYKDIVTSDTIIDYTDCVFTLKSSNIQFKELGDFKGKRVWAFKPAQEVLGTEYKKVILNAAEYNEYTDQLIQPNALSKGRMDFAVSDRNIFYSQALKDKIDYKLFNVFTLNKGTPRVVRFNSVALRDLFNDGLKTIKSNGTYDKILAKYKDLYSSKCI